MTEIKANNTARAHIARTCGILKSKKKLSQELLDERSKDKKRENKNRYHKAKLV